MKLWTACEVNHTALQFTIILEAPKEKLILLFNNATIALTVLRLEAKRMGQPVKYLTKESKSPSLFPVSWLGSAKSMVNSSNTPLV